MEHCDWSVILVISQRHISSVLLFSRPRSEDWPHHEHTFFIYLCPLPFWLTLLCRVLSLSWCCPSRLCAVFLACMHLALFLALSFSPGNSLVYSRCDHSMLASLLWQYSIVSSFYSSFVEDPLISFLRCPRNSKYLPQSFHLRISKNRNILASTILLFFRRWPHAARCVYINSLEWMDQISIVESTLE